MMHPDVELKKINEMIGYGVFAKKFIPRGTIVYVKDELEIVIKANDPRLRDPRYRPFIEKYSYVEANGDYIISWDFSKYVNHCCNANCLTTGYGFEISVRDIYPGEEITDDYGIFYKVDEMELTCGNKNCRKKLRPEEFDQYSDRWDRFVKVALKGLPFVEQPLFPYIDEENKRSLMEYLKTSRGYMSVAVQRPDSVMSPLPQVARVSLSM